MLVFISKIVLFTPVKPVWWFLQPEETQQEKYSFLWLPEYMLYIHLVSNISMCDVCEIDCFVYCSFSQG